MGIENVGNGTTHPITEAQIAANTALIRQLSERYPITHLIGHHEHNAMEGHPYFQEQDPKYRTTKIDPGDEIMSQIRAGLSDLGLQKPDRL